ncbi:hypothetical protein AMECASPLE_024956 [Ameca splendens]|uniref:4Fe-4S ferredoxin-type domain-containing protein n=1 Tax=Ameca splendens TaxID=208324 RepID=A0ABV0Y4E8_9TELE
MIQGHRKKVWGYLGWSVITSTPCWCGGICVGVCPNRSMISSQVIYGSLGCSGPELHPQWGSRPLQTPVIGDCQLTCGGAWFLYAWGAATSGSKSVLEREQPSSSYGTPDMLRWDPLRTKPGK